MARVLLQIPRQLACRQGVGLRRVRPSELKVSTVKGVIRQQSLQTLTATRRPVPPFRRLEGRLKLLAPRPDPNDPVTQAKQAFGLGLVTLEV